MRIKRKCGFFLRQSWNNFICVSNFWLIFWKVLLWEGIVYYVPRQSSRCLYEDAAFNVLAEGDHGKTAFEYEQFDCLDSYDTSSEIGQRKREFVCRGAEVKLRLIVLRMCACGVLSHLYWGRESGGESPGGRSEGPYERASVASCKSRTSSLQVQHRFGWMSDVLGWH